MMKMSILIAAATAATLSVPAIAHTGHAAKPMAGMMMNDRNNPYAGAEMDMHQKMMAAKMGDASEMWTRKMIEHHRGAVSMSRVALTRAQDAETKQMAQMTIDKQEMDIAKLQGWLSSHGKRPQ